MNLYVDIGKNVQGLVMVCSRRSRVRHALCIFLSTLKQSFNLSEHLGLERFGVMIIRFVIQRET